MEDIKGKAVEVESGDMADVGLPIQGMGLPMKGDQGIGFHQEKGKNRVGALRRLSELRARRRLAAAAEGFGCSASVINVTSYPNPSALRRLLQPYWQNNRSCMFVLEKTGDFVRAHGLQSGDFMMVYKDGQSERFYSAVLFQISTIAAVLFQFCSCNVVLLLK